MLYYNLIDNCLRFACTNFCITESTELIKLTIKGKNVEHDVQWTKFYQHIILKYNLYHYSKFWFIKLELWTNYEW